MEHFRQHPKEFTTWEAVKERGPWPAAMTDLILLLQADLDIQAAFGRYEEYQTGRGQVFMRQLDAAFTLLRRYPEIAPVYMGPYRRMLIRHFP